MKGRYVLLTFILFSWSCSNLFFEERPADNVAVFDAFFDEIKSHYSFFNVISFDGFESEYHFQRDLLANNPSNAQLINSLQVLVNYLQDGHTDVFELNRISYDDWFSLYPQNELPDISTYFSNYSRVNSVLEWGEIQDENIGYIRIKSFSGFQSEFGNIDDILADIGNSEAIIIDVRSNDGGNTENADLIISRFNDASRIQHRARRRTAGITDFSPWVEVRTETFSGPPFTAPVFVLTNRRCFSSTEWFVAGMGTIPHVTIVGDTTGGGSGNPLKKELPNGWFLRTSNTQKELAATGEDYQFIGISPDIAVWISEQDSLAGKDTILEEAIKLAKE